MLGGNGFVGSAMVGEAQRRGYAVRPVTQADYAEHTGLACDLLINANGNSKKYLAARDPALDFSLSVESVHRSIRDFKARHYLYISSIDVYPDVADPRANAEAAPIDLDRLSPYGRHKRQAELLVQRHAPSWLILRAGGLVGPRMWKNSVYDLLQDRPLRVHPDSQYQYLHTREMARLAFDLARESAWGETFNVAGDGVIALRDVAGLIPGCRLRTHAGDVAIERYEVDISKLKRRGDVPATRDAVARFVAAVRAGEEPIAPPRP